MKNVIITGTSRGIGLELVKIFNDNGFKVLALSRDMSSIEELCSKNVHGFSFDITKQEDIDKIANYVKSQFGPIDAIIHNAGALIAKPFEMLSYDDFEYLYKVNVFGIAMLTKALLPQLSKGAHVVGISSIGGVRGSVKFPGLAAYSSSKGALITLIEVLAEEFKDRNIAFNALALGAVQTEMLSEAFPDYKTDMQPKNMAKYIFDFTISGHKFYNGKVLEVSNSTP